MDSGRPMLMFKNKWVKTSLIRLYCLAVLAGCSPPATLRHNGGAYVLDRSHSSAAQNARIRFLIFHYTAVDLPTSLKLLTGEEISAHYLISDEISRRSGLTVVYPLVREDRRAWHAGVSHWNGRTGLNDTSIGIEIVNPGFTENMLGRKTWYSYSEPQISALAALAKEIMRRHGITPDNVLAHSDIAPLRKQDPGILFPWKALAAQGVGVWPDPQRVCRYLDGRAPDAPADILPLQAALRRYGYDQTPLTGELDEDTRIILSAFQMHFRPDNIDGLPDAETAAIVQALNDQYRPAPRSPL